MASLEELVLADPAESWAALGFRVEHDACGVGTVTLRLAGRERGTGIVEWALAGAQSADIEGLPTRLVDAPAAAKERPEHPNGALRIDHLVVSTGTLDRTIASLEDAGIDLRRLRDDRPRRMAFFRLGEVILELVEADEGSPPAFWGLVVTVSDLDRLAADLGDRLGRVHAAVQEGRRIATVRGSAGVGPALAFMSR
jgi:hypothetical protein